MANQDPPRNSFCGLPQEFRDMIYEHVSAEQSDFSASMEELRRWSPHITAPMEEMATFSLALALSRPHPILLVNKSYMAKALDVYLKHLQLSTTSPQSALDRFVPITPPPGLLYEKVRKVAIESRYYDQGSPFGLVIYCPYENLNHAKALFPNPQEIEVLLNDKTMDHTIGIEQHC